MAGADGRIDLAKLLESPPADPWSAGMLIVVPGMGQRTVSAAVAEVLALDAIGGQLRRIADALERGTGAGAPQAPVRPAGT